MATWARDMVRARVVAVMLMGIVLIGAGFAYYLSATATGTLTILVRDAPATWDQFIVTFSEVRVLPAGVGNDSAGILLSLATPRIDFTALGNLTALLAHDRAAPGTYGQLRIKVSAAVGVPVGGAPISMLVSAEALVAKQTFGLRGGGTTTVTIDLDLAQSVHQAGEQWIFSPVVGSVVVS